MQNKILDLQIELDFVHTKFEQVSATLKKESEINKSWIKSGLGREEFVTKLKQYKDRTGLGIKPNNCAIPPPLDLTPMPKTHFSNELNADLEADFMKYVDSNVTDSGVDNLSCVNRNEADSGCDISDKDTDEYVIIQTIFQTLMM